VAHISYRRVDDLELNVSGAAASVCNKQKLR